MKFSKLQKIHFGTYRGAYSKVTSTEYKDSQITLTDFEYELAVKYFGRSLLHTGNVRSGGGKARKTFRLHGSGRKIILNLIYPKPGKSELRLYLSKTAGFKPSPGEIWFIFIKSGEIYIGSKKDTAWRSLGRTDPDDSTFLSELYDEDSASTSAAPAKKRVTSYRYPRDPKLALKRIRLSRYQCEVEPAIGLFTARSSGMPYLEAHHLIPLSLQSEFKGKKLDRMENICALSPHHHRRIHLGTVEEAAEVIESLWLKRKSLKRVYGVSIKDVLSFYNCETIR